MLRGEAPVLPLAKGELEGVFQLLAYFREAALCMDDRSTGMGGDRQFIQ
ncbi:MAG: hypothetical protein AAGD25_25195 [Cyanobacteria bacterium P01_F01_bin.150]